MGFRGVEVPLELAKFGLVGSRNLASVPPNAMLTLKNVSLYEGTVRRGPGSKKYNSAAISGTPKVRGVLDWWPIATTQRLVVVTSAGVILRDDTGTGTFATTMKSGLDVNGLPVWAEGGAEVLANNRKAFMTNGKNVVQVISGDAATTADITSGAAGKPDDWAGTNQPRSLFPHNNRMWGILNHYLYGSSVTNHEDYKTSPGVTTFLIPVAPGDSEKLQGGMSFKGRLFLWKWPRGIYWLDDSSTTPSNWAVKRLTRAVGLAGPNALDLIDDDVIFVSEVGHIHLLSGVTEFGDVRNSDLTALNELIPFVRDQVELTETALERTEVKYYPEKKEAIIAMRSKGSQINDLIFKVDFNRADTPRIHTMDKDVSESLAIRKDANGIGRPISGDNLGFVWHIDESVKSKDGAGYNTEFQTPHTDFAWFDAKLGPRRKNFHWLEAVFQPIGDFTLNIDTIIDGNFAETIAFNTGNSGAALGTFILGTDKLAGDEVVNRRQRIRGDGRRLSLNGRMSTANEDFAASLFYIGLAPGSEKE